jgi:hypothetical protein
MKFNVLQTTPGGSQTMLGCNVDRETAERYCQKYTDGAPGCDRARVANGFPPLEAVYTVVEAEGHHQSWLPPELARMSPHQARMLERRAVRR